MKKYNKVRTAAVVLAVSTLFGVMTSCGPETPAITSTQAPQATTQTTNERIYDYSANLPDALFYSPKYEKLDSAESKKLNSFVNYLTMGYMSQGNSVITTGTWVYFIDPVEKEGRIYHKLAYTTWDKMGSVALYISDETFNKIRPVLVRSALRTKISGVNGGDAYLYEYNPNNVYDKNEVNVLVGSLYETMTTDPLYQSQWQSYNYSSMKIETESEMV